MKKFYTYMHTRKSDDKVFYIGKGKGTRANSSSGRSEYWTRVANKHGFFVQILAHWPSEEDAFLHEKFLISYFKDLSAPLVNMTLGGEGSSGNKHSLETRQKMSLAHKGKVMPIRSAEHKAKLSQAQTGKSPGNKGISPSKETRILQSLAKIGRKHSIETRQKMSDARKGRVLSEATRAKLSQTKKGRPMSEETKAKLSLMAKARMKAKHQLMTNGMFPEIIGLDDRVAHINTALSVLTA